MTCLTYLACTALAASWGSLLTGVLASKTVGGAAGSLLTQAIGVARGGGLQPGG